MFEQTGGRLQLDINSLLVNIYIYTYRQLCWERGNIHCVRPLGRMHIILVVNMFLSILLKNVKAHLDNNKVYGALLTDLSRAFDCLPPKMLISKLNAYAYIDLYIYMYNRQPCKNIQYTLQS